MSGTAKIILIAAAVILLAAAALVAEVLRGCCGARQAPGVIEASIATRLRSWAVPTQARNSRNPFVSSPELLQESSHHFADHCASCHGNDGSGNTEVGRNLYPRAPDMRLAATQQLSDGELYYIIHSGVRWTGMPAWGGSGDDPDSWKLVLFIRHLRSLTDQEIRDMQRFNPKSQAEREEEEEEQQFLEGGSAPPSHTEKSQ